MREKIWSIFSLAAALALASVFAVGEAAARPLVCTALERQLASGGNGGGGNFSRYARAAAAQSEQIGIARAQARRAGCGGGLLSIFGGQDNSRGCTRIMRSISRMEANHSALLRKRDGFSGGGFVGSRRAILASLEANGCNGARIIKTKIDRKLPSPVQEISAGGNSLFDQIFSDEPAGNLRKNANREKNVIQKVRRNDVAATEPRREGNSVFVPMATGGTVRTLCVRTCDGFYFPVSFSTTKDRFPKDAAACTAMCPGAEAKLYYHSIPDEEPEQMVDVDGAPYMSLPTAFKYRVNGARSTPGCSCQAAADAAIDPVSALEELDNGKKSKKPAKWLAVPQQRPDLWMDGETIADVRSGLTTEQLGNLLGAPDGTEATASLENSKIRIVGPEFLPARTGLPTLASPPSSVR